MDAYLCTDPDCERSFESLQGLNVHRARTHDLPFLSEEEYELETKPAAVVDGGVVTSFLTEAFPQGVPVEKLDDVVEWREATLRLLR